jgi:hypothetical protein
MKHEDRIQESGDRIQKKMKKNRIQESESRRQETRKKKDKGERTKPLRLRLCDEFSSTDPTNAARDGLYDTRTLRLYDPLNATNSTNVL